MIIAIEYARALLSAAWRAITGRDCRCPFCADLAAFHHEQQQLLADDQGDYYQPAAVPTLDEARRRRGLL